MRRWKRPGLVQNLHLSRSKRLLLDTSAFIYFLSGVQPYLPLLLPLFRRVQAGEAEIVVSVVTEVELLVKPLRDGAVDAVERIGDLLSEKGIEVHAVDRRIGRRAAVLRSQHNLRLPDAIIVATAIETGCEAIVGNDAAWLSLKQVPFLHLGGMVDTQGTRRTPARGGGRNA
jgi:predicted nucleic acid-binding protein